MDMMKSSDAFQNRMLRMARIRTAASLVSMLVLLVIGYFALLMGGQLQVILNDAQSTFETLNALSVQIEEADIPGLFDNVGVLVEDAQVTINDAMEGVEQAIGKIDALDIETLNKAIVDLSAVVEPLAKLFGGNR